MRIVIRNKDLEIIQMALNLAHGSGKIPKGYRKDLQNLRIRLYGEVILNWKNGKEATVLLDSIEGIEDEHKTN